MNRLLGIVAALLIAAPSLADTTPPELGVAFWRIFPGQYIDQGSAALVTAQFVSDETAPIVGLYYSEQFPSWLEVTPLDVTLNGESTPFVYELGDVDEVVPGTYSHRWILDDPVEIYGDRTVLSPGDVLAVTYHIRSYVVATFAANADGWFGLMESPEAVAVGGWDAHSPIIRIVPATDAGAVPGPALLSPAYPNPFNPSTTLRFRLERDVALRLEVVDATGRRLRLLADGPYAAGSHELRWDGRDEAGNALPSGLYLARLSGRDVTTQTQKLLLLK